MKRAVTGNRSVAILSALLACALLPDVLRAEAAATDLSIPEIVRRAAQSVVSIDIYDKAGDLVSSGTGFFIAPHLVLTNAHVIEDSHSLSVSLLAPKKRTDRRPRLIKSDPEADLALLRVDQIDAPPLTLENDVPVEPGQRVVAYGNDYEGVPLVSEGIVRACLKEEIITSAPIHAGHSGSPLFDMQGRVIGIFTANYDPEDGENMSFAANLRAIAQFMKSPDVPRSFPVAGASLFWPRLWKGIAGFFEDLFGGIFDVGDALFELYLKIASVLILALLVLRIAGGLRGAFKARKAAATDSRPVMAYLAFAVYVMTLICSVFLGLYVILALLIGEPLRVIVACAAVLAAACALCYFTRIYYRQHRPRKKARAKKGSAAASVRQEADRPADWEA